MDAHWLICSKHRAPPPSQQCGLIKARERMEGEDGGALSGSLLLQYRFIYLSRAFSLKQKRARSEHKLGNAGQAL